MVHKKARRFCRTGVWTGVLSCSMESHIEVDPIQGTLGATRVKETWFSPSPGIWGWRRERGVFFSFRKDDKTMR